MSFTAEKVYFLYHSGFIPKMLMTAHGISSGRDPHYVVEIVLAYEAHRRAAFVLSAIGCVIIGALCYVVYQAGGAAYALSLACAAYGILLSVCMYYQIKCSRAVKAFEGIGGIGHDLWELHNFAQGILRSGSDSKTCRDCYRAAMKPESIAAANPGAPSAARQMLEVRADAMFDLGARFRLHKGLRGGWRQQYLPSPKQVAKGGLDVTV